MASGKLIDDFVTTLLANGTRIEPRNNAVLAAEFEHQLGRRLPSSYRSLIARYEFAAFDIGGITLYGTERGDEYEAVPRISFRDRALYDVIGPAGFLPIGRPDTGSTTRFALMADEQSRIRNIR
jgi:hypothetical protein